jgi:hypothetical protein
MVTQTTASCPYCGAALSFEDGDGRPERMRFRSGGGPPCPHLVTASATYFHRLEEPEAEEEGLPGIPLWSASKVIEYPELKAVTYSNPDLRPPPWATAEELLAGSAWARGGVPAVVVEFECSGCLAWREDHGGPLVGEALWSLDPQALVEEAGDLSAARACR